MAQTPRPEQRLDVNVPPSGDVVTASVASAGDLSVAVYTTDDFPNSGVFARMSDAAGVSWGPPVRIDEDFKSALKIAGVQNNTPGVAIVGDTVYAVWIDERPGFTDADLYFARSEDRGASWIEQRIDKGLPAGASNDVDSYAFVVSPDPAGDHVYIGMELGPSGPDPIFLAASHDGGLNFQPTVPLSTQNGVFSVTAFSLAAEGSVVVVAFSDSRGGVAGQDDLWVRRSTDGGTSFSPAVQVDGSGPGMGDLVDPPAIAIDGNRVAVAWLEELEDPANEEVHVAVSVDGGQSFLADMRLSTPSALTTDADDVRVALCGPLGVIVAWDDNSVTGTLDTSFVRTSADNGLSYGLAQQVSNPGTARPGLATDGSGLVVVASELASSVEAAWSADCGVSFTPPFVVSGPGGTSQDDAQPVLNVETDNVHLLWFASNAAVFGAYLGGFSLCTGPAASGRNGGSNPNSLTASELLLGTVFTASVDVQSTGHAMALLIGFSTPASLALSGGRVLLVDPTDPAGELFSLTALSGPVAEFVLEVPNDPSLCGFPASAQAVHFGGPPFVLSNALDLTVRAL